jgi:hypothetical protein
MAKMNPLERSAPKISLSSLLSSLVLTGCWINGQIDRANGGTV